jgi:membrane protein
MQIPGLKIKKMDTEMIREFMRFFKDRYLADNIGVNAGYLSYMTLLSIVPLITVMLSVLSAFPVFESVKTEIENFIFRNFVPASGEVIQTHIREFVTNTSKMTAVGVTAVVVVALMLIFAVDRTLNTIWRTRHTRRSVVSFSIYWMILTLGPVLIGASLALTSYLVGLAQVANGTFSGFWAQILKWLPYMISLTAFLLLYQLVPNYPVSFPHALSGAVVAAILFELCKKAFAFYVTHFPTYQTIYGALAVVPILFVWIYLSWMVVLIGAEIAACLGDFRAEEDAAEESA